MSFYHNNYVPAFSTNHTYGNFYDSSRVSLISVPERLKNYDLDVRKANTPTTASEYGDFLRGAGIPHRGPLTYASLQRQQAELMQQQQQQQPQQHQQQLSGAPHFLPAPSEPQQQQQLQHKEDDEVSRQSPPNSPSPPPLPPPPHHLSWQQQPPQQSQQQQPYQYRTSRARSPPPPPEMSAYRLNPDAYTGRAQQLQQPPQQPQQPPPLRLAGREVHLPSIESVEVRMRDNSKVVLDVMDFYRRYLRD